MIVGPRASCASGLHEVSDPVGYAGDPGVRSLGAVRRLRR